MRPMEPASTEPSHSDPEGMLTRRSMLPRLLAYCVDSLYVSLFVDPSASAIDWADLEYRKERLRQGQGEDFTEIRLGSETLALKPFGRKPYRYVLGNDVFEIRLSETIRPACHVQFLSKG